MPTIQFAEEHDGSLRLQGLIRVPHLPAVGDTLTNDTIVGGKATKVYAQVAKVLAHPRENPAVDAIVVLKTLRVEQRPMDS